jgi:hypothetical protein
VNKKFLLTSILLLVLVVSACDSNAADLSTQVSGAAETSQGDEGLQGGGGQRDSDNGGQQPANQTEQETGFNREMPLAMTLALGTFKLEESEHPVDPDQATEMLVLWKAARSLSESDNTAAEEMDAVINQIQDAFSPEQLAEIEEMGISFQDMRAIAEQMGIELGFGSGGFGDLTPEQQATMEAARESGQFPRGGFGGDFPGSGPGGGPGGAGMSPERRETAMAEDSGFQRVNLGLPQPILEAVIDFLEGRAG